MSRPLRRTRRDLLVTGALAALAVAAVTGVAVTAPTNGSQLHPASSSVATDPLAAPPTALTEAFTLADAELPGQHRPLTVAGLLITTDGFTVRAHDPAGDEAWRYERDREICAVGTAWHQVTIAYRGPAGCGDVVAIDAQTGQYDSTRSAIAGEQVVPVESNDRFGILSPERVELWRSDLVRTVEYGAVEAKQEPASQPNEDCTLTSALTRTESLVTTEACPDGTWLRFQATTPEDSRTPELLGEIAVADESRLVAIGQEAAAVYSPGPEPQLLSYDPDGTLLESRDVAPAAEPSGLDAPATADLPHHMSWFDGERLYLLGPTRLQVSQIFEDAIGTGVAVGESFLYPTADGIAVADPDTGETHTTLPVARGTGAVSLSLAGGTIVEKRGDQVVGLVQAP